MKTPLPNINIESIYFKDKKRLPLPKRMAQCTPDTQKALIAIGEAVEKKGGRLILSDLFRSYDMQLQAHLDFVTGRKKAFSPPPGGSMHEAGRAFDLDLDSLKIKLADFWKIAEKFGVFPIIEEPKAGVSESWHFDCRGSHQKVYEYYKAKKGTNMKAYTAMSASGILSIGVRVDAFGKNQTDAAIQAGLIRLGFELGNIDGDIGQKTRIALDKAGIEWTTAEGVLLDVENQLKEKYPAEYEVNLSDDVIH
jgi:hypothetical protein